jgi:hypothetical protein
MSAATPRLAAAPLPPFTRRRIAALAADVLRASGAEGVLPTPMEPVRRAAGIRALVDLCELPADPPPALGRILGAYWYEARTAFVAADQSEPRRRFTAAHEAAHAMCPWHGDTLRLDDAATLVGRVRDQIEAEANFGAARLIFQGARFHAEAAELGTSLRTPLALAERYGASRHAALHHYAEEHPDAVALLVAGRWPQRDGTLPIWSTVESPSFLARHGRLADRLGTLDGPLAEILEEARRANDPPGTRVRLSGASFTAEAYYNRHCHFVLVAEAYRRSRSSCAANSASRAVSRATASRTPSRSVSAASYATQASPVPSAASSSAA